MILMKIGKKRKFYRLQFLFLIALVFLGLYNSSFRVSAVQAADINMGSYLKYQISDLDCTLDINGESRDYFDIFCNFEINFTPLDSIYQVVFKFEFSNSENSEPFLTRENAYQYNYSSNTFFYQNGTEIGNFFFFQKSIENISEGQKIKLYNYLNDEFYGECNSIDNILKIGSKIYHLKSFRYEPSNRTSSLVYYERSAGILIIGWNLLELPFFAHEFGILKTSGLYDLNLIQTDFVIPYEIDEDNSVVNNNDYSAIIILGVVVSSVVILYVIISKRRK
ncbi:MAG: hypothetical protein DRO88_03215 [Promethearchaeia archaeon]|nr:MAG: hypothetical protein DRO88_03215 [Candidatus Lokiarchaeia archaeon]